MTPKNVEFVNSLIPGAQAAQKAHGVPASVTIAQAVLESAWGNSGLTLEGCNLFGIKADASWHGAVTDWPTDEVIAGVKVRKIAAFRKYHSLAESIDDHALFLKNNERYREAFECASGCDFARAIAKAGYATDPAYGNLLVSLINQHVLQRYDEGVTVKKA